MLSWNNRGNSLIKHVVEISLVIAIIFLLSKFLPTNIQMIKTVLSGMEYSRNAQSAGKTILETIRQTKEAYIKYDSTTKIISSLSKPIINFTPSDTCSDTSVKLWYHKAPGSDYGDIRDTKTPTKVYADKILSITTERSSDNIYLKMTIKSGIKNDKTSKSYVVYVPYITFYSEGIIDFSDKSSEGYGFGNSKDQKKLWQIFTTKKCPILSDVDIKIRRVGGLSQSDLILQLYEVYGGLPGGDPVASSYISSDLVSQDYTLASNGNYANYFSLLALNKIYSFSVVKGLLNYQHLKSETDYAIAISQQNIDQNMYYEWCVGSASNAGCFGKWNDSEGPKEISSVKTGWMQVHTSLYTPTPTVSFTPTPTYLPAPVITSNMHFTDKETETIYGIGEPNSNVIVTGKNIDVSCTSNSDGKFCASINLNPNETNTLNFYEKDLWGNIMSNTATFEITQVSAPILTTTSCTVNSPNMAVYGLAGAYSTLTILRNDVIIAAISADADGYFSVPIKLLKNEENNISIKQTIAGYEGPASMLKITQLTLPPDAPTLSSTECHVTQSDTSISGIAKPYAYITISQEGMDLIAGSADEFGNFNIPIDINTSTENIFSVIQTDPEGNTSTSASIITIKYCTPTPTCTYTPTNTPTLTSTPTSTPTLTPTGTSTPIPTEVLIPLKTPTPLPIPSLFTTSTSTVQETVQISGTAITGAIIKITRDGDEVASGTVDANGVFLITVTLIKNDINIFCVTQTYDGNTSPKVKVKITQTTIPN